MDYLLVALGGWCLLEIWAFVALVHAHHYRSIVEWHATGECCTKCHSRTFDSNVLRLCTKDEMQGAEDEGEGSVLTYVTEPEFR